MDQKEKQEFINSEQVLKFCQFLAIVQIRTTQTDECFFTRHIMNVERALYRGVRDLLIKNSKIESKDQFNVRLYDYQYFQQKALSAKVFYSDININYITASTQLKATSYVYISTDLIDALHNQQINLNFKKLLLKYTIYFVKMEYINLMSSMYLNEEPVQAKSSPIPLLQLIDKTNLAGSSQSEIMDPCFKKKAPLPLCHQTNWLKQAFVRTNKFREEYITLTQTGEDDLKSGITIYFVYRPLDDQIYAVKKSRLSSSVLTYYDLFSTVTIGDQTSDQRKIREAKILAKLRHPNVLRQFDWWVEQDKEGYALYMQTEYCSYPGYKHQTNDLLNFAYYYMNPMNNKEKLETLKHIMLQILDGLEYIHKRGIVHRDLKPENVFITITTNREIQVMLADFDQGKDVRESKLSIITDEKISENELNSIRAKNTIQSGTSGYQTPNSFKNQSYDQCDEFYALGITLLHLVLTFPGEPKNRNLYTNTFSMSDIDDVLMLFDTWANKFVKNKPKEFNFCVFQSQLELAKKLLDKRVKEHDHIRQIIQSW